MGSISHHIMPLVVHSLGGSDTHTHTCIHTFTDRNQATGRHTPGLVNLANHEPFAKLFLTNIHRYTENVSDFIYLAYLPNFSSPVAFTCMVCQNITLPNISLVWSIFARPTVIVLIIVVIAIKHVIKRTLSLFSIYVFTHW